MASSGRTAAHLSTSRRPLPKLTCHLARRAGVLAGRGEQAEERADPVPVLGGVPEHAVAVDGVPGAPPGAGAGQVSGGLQVRHDGLDSALGQSGRGTDVPDPGAGVAGDLYEHVPVPGQQRPAATALVRVVGHASRLYSSREKTRELFLVFLLTGVLPRPILVVLLAGSTAPPLPRSGSGTAAVRQQ